MPGVDLNLFIEDHYDDLIIVTLAHMITSAKDFTSVRTEFLCNLQILHMSFRLTHKVETVYLNISFWYVIYMEIMNKLSS